MYNKKVQCKSFEARLINFLKNPKLTLSDINSILSSYQHLHIDVMLLWPRSGLHCCSLSPHKSLFSDRLCNIGARAPGQGFSLVPDPGSWPLIGCWRPGGWHYAIQSPTTLNIWIQTFLSLQKPLP